MTSVGRPSKAPHKLFCHIHRSPCVGRVGICADLVGIPLVHGGTAHENLYPIPKAGLFCQVPVSGDVTQDSISPSRVLKDLVCEKKLDQSF